MDVADQRVEFLVLGELFVNRRLCCIVCRTEVPDDAIDLIKGNAERRFAWAQVKYADYFNSIYNMDTRENGDEFAAQLYMLAAKQGNAEGQNKLGVYYELGFGLEQSFEQALYWYKESAAQNHSVAIYNYGRLILQDRAPSEKASDALLLFERSAALGHIESMNILGEMFRDGIGGIKDSHKLMDYWFDAARNNGCKEANFNIGKNYSLDRSDRSVPWLHLRKYCVEGDVEACFISGSY